VQLEGPHAMSDNKDPQLGPGQQRFQARCREPVSGRHHDISVNYDPDTGRLGTIKFGSGKQRKGK
jgi:hypothetical protein